MSDYVRVGLIGCGRHGLGVLAPALESTDHARLVACTDDNELAATRAQERLGLDRLYLDYHDMLDSEDLDAVIVAVPHHLLKDVSIAVARSGRHVFVEKPMALNPADGELISRTSKDAGISLMVGFCQRFSEGRRTIKSLIDRGAIGEVTAFIGAKGNPPLTGWLADPDKGGGELHWVGVHITDQLLWLTGSQPERVYGEIVWHPETGADQTANFTVRMRTGVVASITCSQSVSGRLDYVEVHGTAGQVRADWPSEVVQVVSDVLPEYRHPTTVRPREWQFGQMYADQMTAWISAIRDRRPPPIDVSDGIAVLKVIDAVFQSERSGRPISLD